jgi:DNA-directed RNA polymerase subunit RPC12/RpoP
MNYPYKCQNCGTEFIITMSVKKYQTVKVYCPICKQENPNRTYYSNGFTIIYKDSDFTKFVGCDE